MAVLIIHSNFKNYITEKVLKPENKSKKSPINISRSEDNKKGNPSKNLFKKFMK